MSGPNEISQFDSQLFRRIGSAAPPGSGVTSYNGLTGAVTGVSSVNGDPGPAVVLPPGVDSLNGLTGDVRVTLDSLFTFGVLDDPFNDNVFEMPTGIRRFRSAPSTGPFDGQWPNDAWVETLGNGADPNVGAWGTVRAQETGVSLTSTFDTHSVFNADFVSNPIDGSTWISTLGLMTSTPSDVNQSGDPMFRESYYGASFFGQQPISQPDAGFAPGVVMYHYEDLYFVANGGPSFSRARQLSGWGQEILFTKAQNNGITPAFIGSLAAFDVAVPAAGDGTGIWFTSGSIDAAHIVGQFEAHQRTADPAGSWGLGLWTYDGDFAAPYLAAEINGDDGLRLYRGGVVLPFRNSAAEPLSTGTDAKIVWDDFLQKVMISVDGGAFVPLSTFS